MERPATFVGFTYPQTVRLHLVLDNWLNRIEAQFRALRYFTLAGTDHPDHATQARLIRHYIAWRNRNTDNGAHQHGKRCLMLH